MTRLPWSSAGCKRLESRAASSHAADAQEGAERRSDEDFDLAVRLRYGAVAKRIRRSRAWLLAQLAYYLAFPVGLILLFTLIGDASLTGALVLAALVVMPGALYDMWDRFGAEAIRRALRTAAFPAQAFAFCAVAAIVGGREGTPEFYAIAAQVLPVFMLALVFQRGVYDLRRISDNDFVGVLAVLLFLAAGEAVALTAVFTAEPRGAFIVAGAVGGALVGVTFHAMGGSDNRGGSGTE